MLFWVCLAALQHVSAALLHRGVPAAPLPEAALLTRKLPSSFHPAAAAHGSMRVQRLRRRALAGTSSAANTNMPAHGWEDAATEKMVNGTSVWVVGWGRSGTTLAMDLLGASAENVFTLYEPCHIGGSDVYRGQVITAANVQELCPRLLIDVLARCDFSQVQGMRHLKKTHEHNDGRVPEYFDPANMTKRCRAAKVRIVKTVHIDESVMSTAGVGSVLKAVPRLKVVSVVRDPRAVYSSRQQCHAAWKASWTGTKRPLLTRMCSQLGQASHWPGRFPGRVHTLRYETLVAHAKDESTRVLRFLGLPVSPRVDAWLRAHMGAETCTGAAAEEYGTCRTPEQQQQALTKWRKLLPPADKAHADLVCARTLRVFAYAI